MTETHSLEHIIGQFTPVKAELGQDGVWHREVSFDSLDLTREEVLALEGVTEEEEVAKLWATYEETLQSFSQATGIAIAPHTATQEGIAMRVDTDNILGEQFVTDFSAMETVEGWRPFAIEPTSAARDAFSEVLPRIIEWTQQRAESGQWILRETAYPSNFVLAETGQLTWVDLDATISLPVINPDALTAQQAEAGVLAAAL